ncbi:contractile injection system protein, VgrG/Pvc8 family [Paenibacillus polymyxa]|uniref:contractile injection system protein, VgrG/Pvc8 family n=1 Tax=Paenibacillus polymyxa TaxID=1406 RepID=UPI002AB41804|nr:contractile injection system protein, VgrG/Pvc8 family [Paenibacillus polymyxa]MDY8025132.1 contractile injection system protein, VgrG/Pvc8 family [Paenibacillus polymyxa]
MITGSLEADQADTIITKASSDDEVELWYSDAKDQKHPLFMGQLYCVDVEHRHQEIMVTLNVISHSFKLDTQLKNRSFQHINQKYVDIVDAVLADYKGSDKIDEAFEKKATGQFIMQYQETDWTFLKRLASHVGALLVPNIVSHHAQIWIGVPQGRQHIQLKEVPFALQRKIAPFLDQEANGWKSASIGDYTQYTFEWDQMLQLGDEVERNHETYVITKREGQLIRGLMTWSYECALSQGLKVPKIYNRTIIGASIEGKILEVSRNQVRLHLDMDNQQNPKDAQWFPYSAEGNQVWYLMPEKGAQVKLYFPSADEDDAMVIQSVRTKPSTVAVPSSHAAQGAVVESPAERHSRKTADPGVKSFANPQGKEISLGNSELSMSAQEGSLYISMNAHHGVSLNSTQHVQIQATGNLSLSAGSILLKGANGLHLNTTTDTLDMEQEVNSVSSEIQLKTSLHQYYPEPLLSDFEKQVNSIGLEKVIHQRKLLNEDKRAEGALNVFTNAAKELWGAIVDVGDILLTDSQDKKSRELYKALNGGKEVAPILERNSTLAGIERTVKYVDDLFTGQKSVSDEFHKAIEGFKEDGKSFIERSLKANNYSNPLTRTPEESYEIGQIKGGEELLKMDIASNFIPGLGAARNSKKALSLSRKLDLPDPKIHVSEKHVPSSTILRGSEKLDAQVAKLGDGKFKTNAIRFPTNFESLGNYLQSVARKMNISITKRLPIFETAGGHYRFHDLGPDAPRSKAGGKVSLERQKQIDALESGEYTGKSTKGKGNVPESIPTKVDWNEYKRVDDYKPTFMDEFQEKEYKAASKDYDDIRSVGMTDIEQVAKNTGMTIEEIMAMKQHMFFDTHKIPLDNQSYRVGHFTPDLEVGFIWKEAQKGELDPKQKKWFQELAKHELTESEKMKQGYPYKNPGSYRKDSDDFGSDPPGAHDVASDQPSFELPGAYDYYSKKVLGQ